jgi:hypothetical protein
MENKAVFSTLVEVIAKELRWKLLITKHLVMGRSLIEPTARHLANAAPLAAAEEGFDFAFLVVRLAAAVAVVERFSGHGV